MAFLEVVGAAVVALGRRLRGLLAFGRSVAPGGPTEPERERVRREDAARQGEIEALQREVDRAALRARLRLEGRR